MNTANLQLEGLYLAVAAVNDLLVAKGMLTRDELDLALHRAESSATAEDRMTEDDISPANRDAICFPIRFLRLANRLHAGDEAFSFSELARRVGETKEPYNDQR